MNEKKLKTRVIHKHDIEDCWRLATNFTPKKGEIIIYDPDGKHKTSRFKIGDGVSNVNDLPFASGLPMCDETNDGQFLRVINGKVAWSTVLNAEEATF